MKQRLLAWSPCHCYHNSLLPPSIPFLSFSFQRTHQFSPPITASLDSSTATQQSQQQLTARERRQLRNKKRESKSGYNWREEVEERLIKLPKKKKVHWAEELNLDNLAHLGPQWWIIRVSRVRGHETADLVARLLARNYPDVDFKIYAPAVQVKRKLKNGTLSVKPKPVFPGCLFLWCVLNKEIHDFIREIDGVGGFIGSKVGNTKRQINKPRPVSHDDMEEVFQQAKEEQEKFDQTFEEEQQGGGNDLAKSVNASKAKGGSNKTSEPLASTSAKKKGSKLPTAGSTVRIVSGTFAEYEGTLKKLNRKTRKATVAFTLFGKETLVDLDINEIAAETN